MLSEKERVEPSIMTEFTIPVWKLRDVTAAYVGLPAQTGLVASSLQEI